MNTSKSHNLISKIEPRDGGYESVIQTIGRLHRRSSIVGSFLILLLTAAVFAQDAARPANPVLWKQVKITDRDLYLGPGGAAMRPDLNGAVVVGRQPGGNNLKFRLRDRAGNVWIAKMADESQPEVAAVRLLWGIGYNTEIDYIVPRLELGRFGSYRNARLEARPKDVTRDRWTWAENPFKGTTEMEGLKIMMAMINNWDLKDENNGVLTRTNESDYIISDLGSSFGKLATHSQSRSGRSVNDPQGYAKSVFIKGSHDGSIDFAYTGSADHLLKGIKIEHGRWLADLLMQLSDKQILDAFRAANYKPEEVSTLSTAFKARVRALDETTRMASVAKK